MTGLPAVVWNRLSGGQTSEDGSFPRVDFDRPSFWQCFLLILTGDTSDTAGPRQVAPIFPCEIGVQTGILVDDCLSSSHLKV